MAAALTSIRVMTNQGLLHMALLLWPQDPIIDRLTMCYEPLLVGHAR